MIEKILIDGNGFLDRETKALISPLFNFLLDWEIRRSFRYQDFASLLILEPDKEPRDIKTLAELVSLIRRNIRETDIIGRLNGLRFGIILLAADLDGAYIMASRIMGHINNYAFSKEPQQRLNISIGGACFPTNSINKDTLFQLAKEMLEEAHKRGGNTICLPHLIK